MKCRALLENFIARHYQLLYRKNVTESSIVCVFFVIYNNFTAVLILSAALFVPAQMYETVSCSNQSDLGIQDLKHCHQ